MNKTIVMAQSQAEQSQLWKQLFSALGFQFVETYLEENSIQKKINNLDCALLILDLNIREFNPYSFCRQIVSKNPDLPVIFTNDLQTSCSEARSRWAIAQGAKGIVLSNSADPDEIINSLKVILSVLKSKILSEGEVNKIVKIIENNNPKKSLESQSKINFSEALYQKMLESSKLEIKDRRWRFKLHKKCFVGSEAVTWLSWHLNISRSEAVKLGQIGLKKGYFAHVCKEHNFKDEYLFYRFAEHEILID